MPHEQAAPAPDAAAPAPAAEKKADAPADAPKPKKKKVLNGAFSDAWRLLCLNFCVLVPRVLPVAQTRKHLTRFYTGRPCARRCCPCGGRAQGC